MSKIKKLLSQAFSQLDEYNKGGATQHNLLWKATCHKKEVNPETVCQRTGMRDCCGVDIYEHDMLEYDLGPFSKTRDVMWLNGTYQLNLEHLYSYISHGIQVKVVGNLIDKCY